MEFIGDFHTHTLASTHAYSTVSENAKWASEHGMKFMAMTDHSIAMKDSPHEWHFDSLNVIPGELFGVRILKGIEANIIGDDGSLDVEERWYNKLQWINASIHYPMIKTTNRETHTRVYLNVLQNKYVDVLCHTEAARYDYDFDAVAKECASQGKLIEVNVTRLEKDRDAKDRYEMILEACEKHGTSIVVSSDAHFYTAIGMFDSAKELLTKIGFPEKLILNIDEERVLAYIRSKRGNIF